MDEKPYYALEYVLSSVSSAPANNANHAPKANIAGRSNVVDRRNALEGIEDIRMDTSDAPHKVMKDNILYILLPDGAIFDATGARVK